MPLFEITLVWRLGGFPCTLQVLLSTLGLKPKRRHVPKARPPLEPKPSENPAPPVLGNPRVRLEEDPGGFPRRAKLLNSPRPPEALKPRPIPLEAGEIPYWSPQASLGPSPLPFGSLTALVPSSP